MLWSLIKVLLFIGIVAVLSLSAGWMLDNGTGVRMTVSGWEFTLGPVQLLIGAILLMLALWLLLRLAGLLVAVVRFLNGDETALSRHFQRNRERKGREAVSDALVALASGEPKQALTRAEAAHKFLNDPVLTTLLIAQTAEQAGERDRAEDAWKKLLAHNRTRFVGIRGLLRQTLDVGDTTTALKLAERAFALKPKHPETQDILLKLQAETADWEGARQTLEAKRKMGALPKAVYQRRDAVLALQQARTVLQDGASIEAREAAIEANKLSPDLIPAAVLAARSYIAQGNKRNASRILRKAWEVQPHPDLAGAFAEIEPEETPQQRLTRFGPLTDVHAHDPEAMMLKAELAIAAEEFPEARRALGKLPVEHPTVRSLTIMAAIERGEGADDTVVRGWLTRALTAPRGPQWCCDKCQTVHAQWTPVCDQCGGFDTLSWREPADTAGPSSTGTELLPLIVGTPDPASRVVNPEPAEEIVPEGEKPAH
ncbi:heme biosynthesis protein HemY [Falsirhodobacter sp. 20TX0035]|uniref:heme biosynthesis protein HemY n=1 Tax=Falsirhodobacter sp. 20TX0035 TaxID=3022019 RepID=UPI00232B580A|nr:heme biosynthesis HemY N-terminal domain-containing protein [Falsirhodobacter sp. 20TX0035]MDB6452737.1 heme biosynthesis HemY N-terminal domain-containing protein [Falsirhodobacter sp. 20TX0035]